MASTAHSAPLVLKRTVALLGGEELLQIGPVLPKVGALRHVVSVQGLVDRGAVGPL